jgi:hypothetical protein
VEATATSAAPDRAIAAPTPPKNIFSRVLAPKDYFLGPVFAAKPQTGPREITIGQHRYLIGGFHPMKRDLRPPALDVRHARAIFSLLSFRDPFEDTRLVRFSFNEFCKRYAVTNGGRYSRAISEIVGDLLDSYIRVTNVGTGIFHQYRLIERIDIEGRPPRRRDSKLARSNQAEMWFNGCTLSPEFFGLLGDLAELQELKLKVFTSIRAPLAQAIYLYIPSRAHHHTEAKPFEITLSRLLEQVSSPIPPHKSVRKKIFSQREEKGDSIIQQLNGLETLSGVFRVRLAETTDGGDFKLQAWVDRKKKQRNFAARDSKLIKAWLASGRPIDLLEQRLSNIQPLAGYEIELLETAKVRLQGNESFFRMAKALLSGSRFVALLSEAKGDLLEDRKATKNPTARLIWRIRETIAAPNQPGIEPKRGLDN